MTRVGSKYGSIDIPVDPARLFPAIAARMFLAGRATDSALPVNDIMRDVLFSLAHGGAGIADDVCASAALYLAEVEVPSARFRKDDLAYGIEPAVQPYTHLIPVRINGQMYSMMAYAPASGRRHARRTAVGVLKEG
jgi:hypothetical protein